MIGRTWQIQESVAVAGDFTVIIRDDEFEHGRQLYVVNRVNEGIMYTRNGAIFTDTQEVLELINARHG